jgi:aspartate carbamoyltransferase catalytic subunit
MLGDLKYGRTVHSLARLLSLYDVRLNYVSPEILRMPSEIMDEVGERGVEQSEHRDLAAVLADTDVLYVTRVQQERFTDQDQYEQVKGQYVINWETLKAAKERMIVMHPLPRVGEISMDVDDDPRAAYFRQMEYGLYTRMALLAMVLGKA